LRCFICHMLCLVREGRAFVKVLFDLSRRIVIRCATWDFVFMFVLGRSELVTKTASANN
jgi:hypothetical protein